MNGYEWRIAWRYLSGHHHNNRFAAFVARLAIGGLILGTAALIIILSVMNGFQSVFRQKLLDGIADAQLISRDDSYFIPNTSLIEQLQSSAGITAWAPYLDGQALIRVAAGTAGVFIRGISPQQEPRVSRFAQRLTAGHWLSNTPWQVLIGDNLAQALHLRVGDHLLLITANSNNPLTGWMPRARTVTIRGIFSLGLYEYDSALLLMSLTDAQILFSHPRALSGIRLKLDDVNAAPRIAHRLNTELPEPYEVMDWTHSHQAFFKAVAIEKMVMFVILALIIMVAAFNIVSSLVMVVHEKKSDIAILKTIGITPASIRRIFFLQGLMIGMIGTIIGSLIGIGIADHLHQWSLDLEHLFHIHFLSKEVYMIHELPSELRITDVLLTSTLSLILCLLAAVYPASVAANTQPAITLREKV